MTIGRYKALALRTASKRCMDSVRFRSGVVVLLTAVVAEATVLKSNGSYCAEDPDLVDLSKTQCNSAGGLQQSFGPPFECPTLKNKKEGTWSDCCSKIDGYVKMKDGLLDACRKSKQCIESMQPTTKEQCEDAVQELGYKPKRLRVNQNDGNRKRRYGCYTLSYDVNQPVRSTFDPRPPRRFDFDRVLY